MPLPRVYISYSHDSEEHIRRVHALANHLRADGVEAWIDQYMQDPDEGWIYWMRRQVKGADKVLLVFTETYQRRFEGDEEEVLGGGPFEGAIVTKALYESGGRNAKFRPVVFREEDERFIPLELRCFNRYRIDTPEHYEAVLRWLHNAPQIVAPAVGPKPDLPLLEQAIGCPHPPARLRHIRPERRALSSETEFVAQYLLRELARDKFPKRAEHRAFPAESERHPVDCTVFAPDRVQRKQTRLLQVLLHAPEDRTQAEVIARNFDAEAKARGHRSLVLDAPIGTNFAFDVEIEGFVLRQRIDSLLWTGGPNAAAFDFEVPKGCRWGQHTGTVRISKDGTPIGRITFQIEVVRDAPLARNKPVGAEARHYRACFCSYSSLDRAEMLKRAQGLRATGLETFIDVLSLRPGDVWNPKIFEAIDESDLFVVIWSKNARDSKWVKRESSYALKRYKQHGNPDFRPIPVEGPPIPSVPLGLQAYHFNDELLSLIRAAELERREREKMKSEDEKPQSQAERQAMVPAGKQADRRRPPVWLALLERFSTCVRRLPRLGRRE